MHTIQRLIQRYDFKIALIRMYGEKPTKALLQQCRNLLNVSINSKPNDIRDAFIKLAKKYHPDSGSPHADLSKFCEVEEAHRVLMRNHELANEDSVSDALEFDIKHTAPQHRQYLSYGGGGHGTVAQRERQWQNARAVKAASNVMEHRVKRAMVDENTQSLVEIDAKKHQHNKTQNQFERLVEDLIQEAMSKGDFDNLSGAGKPLKGQNMNPYVDFTTHKLNQVLINNGFTPEWIVLNKDIRESVEKLKKKLRRERSLYGPHPLSEEEHTKWTKTCDDYKGLATDINKMISDYNLIVPILDRQMLLMNYEKVSENVLISGEFRVTPVAEKTQTSENEDIVRLAVKNFKLFYEVLRSVIGKWQSKDNDKTRV